MKLSRRIAQSRAFQVAVGTAAAQWLRLVWYTNHKTILPADLYEDVEAHFPIIVTMWHGQHFLTPFISKYSPHYKTKVLISRHRDGEINAIAAENLGIGTIRGSGDTGGRFDLKGGVGAFKAMIDTLASGSNVALTADVPKVARVAGLGVIKLAQHSGRQIHALAIASRRRIELKNWDRSAINLPFGRIGLVATPPIFVPRDADAAGLETARQNLESELNRITARAYEMADHGGDRTP